MSSEAEILNQLNLGTSKAILDNKPQSALGQLLLSITEDIIVQLQNKIKEYNISTSSMGLSQSLAPTEVKIENGVVSVGISADFYWKFVNYGVNGTEVSHGAPDHGATPPGTLSFKESILQWIPQRGLQLPEQFGDFEQFSYAIMTNIRKHGKAPRPFFTDVVNNALINRIQEPIEKVIGRALKIRIVEPWQ